MKKYYLSIASVLILAAVLNFWDCYRNNNLNNTNSGLTTMQNQNNNNTNYKVLNSVVKINPVNHATLVITWGDKNIYIDPLGGKEAFSKYGAADIILVTHSHSDHFDPKTLEEVLGNAAFITTLDVVDKLPETLKGKALATKNGELKEALGFKIYAVPAYNIKPEQQQYHPKGRDNGYIIEKDGFRVYVAGDTAGTPEMRALKNIDIAFVPMNLPYTMPVEEAASAVLDFKPKQVWPYHYREGSSYADLDKFKSLINQADPNIDVVLGKWY